MPEKLIAAGITIINIRTSPEWKETRVVTGSVLLTFYRKDRSYDIEGFIAALRRHVAPEQELAILCRRGNRSARVSAMLTQRGFSSVVNLSGGVQSVRKSGVPLEPYAAKH